LDGQRLVIVQPIGVGDVADGPLLIAVDAQSCRKGDRVMLTSDGTYARDVTEHSGTPARWSVMGIMDDTESK
jgi:ethanolamine utilization protein EutN